MTVSSPASGTDCSIDDLIDRYDVFLLDAYGVLVTTRGAIDGASSFLERLDREGREWMIVSNDASRSIATTTARYRDFGLPVTPERVLTSGALLPAFFQREGLAGARCIVLGTEDSRDYVRESGGIVVNPDDEASVCVVCGVYDEPAAPFLETVNRTVSVVLSRLGRGESMRFVLPNPDIVYPSDVGAFSFTAGALAAMLEAVMRLRDPEGRHRFEPLGKPYAPMFEAALERAGQPDRRQVVMIGDQLVTDVLGAARAGLDSVLIDTGVSRPADVARSPVKPTWMLRDLATRRR